MHVLPDAHVGCVRDVGGAEDESWGSHDGTPRPSSPRLTSAIEGAQLHAYTPRKILNVCAIFTPFTAFPAAKVTLQVMAL